MVVQFRLKEIMAKHERLTGQKVTYRALRDATGISTNTLQRMGKNQQKMVGLSVIDRLCEFFDCEPGDLIVRIPDDVSASERSAD